MKTNLKIAIAMAASLSWQATAQDVVPNDPRFHQQYGLEYTQTPLAWNLTTGSMKVVIAVNDSGVDYTHPDLYLNIWINQDEIPSRIRNRLEDLDGDGLITFRDLNHPSNQGAGRITDLNGNGYIDGGDLLFSTAAGGWADGRDNHNNGFVDDLIGWDFLDNDNDPMDSNGHGTHVAGIIGATANNGVGVAGINWKVSLMPVRRAVIPFSALVYAVDNGARVSNHSYGATLEEFSLPLMEAGKEVVRYAQERGHLFVAAAGNDGVDIDQYPFFFPAGYDLPNIISVAATDRADRLASFSNFGALFVDLGAPGHTAWSTYIKPESQPYALQFGTSMAAPHVVGAAALILSVNPSLSYSQVKALILDNVDPIADLDGLTVSGGRLNIANAVAAALK